MNKRDNPYTPGPAASPARWPGGDQDMEAFQSLVERLDAGTYERSLVYTGLRGVGKTVLLMEFDVLASEAGWATTDVQEVGLDADFRTTFARMAARLLMNMSRRHRAKQRIERALSVVKAFSIAIPGTVELKLDVEAATGVADSGDPEQDLAGLFREIGEVAQANQMGALFLIDEMQNLDGRRSPPSAWPSRPSAGPASRSDGRRRPPRPAGAAAGGQALRRPPVFVRRARPSLGVGRLVRTCRPGSTAGVAYDEKPPPDRERGSRVPLLPAGIRGELWNFAETSPITEADLEGPVPL